jgi:3-oxoacyl-[acyl-carrier protein] reductase
MANSLATTMLRWVGVPAGVPLIRRQPGDMPIRGPVAVGNTPGSRLGGVISATSQAAGVRIAAGRDRPAALIFDATGLKSATGLAAVYEFVHANIRNLTSGARIVVLGDVPAQAATVGAATAAQALEGFTRSLGKEMRGGGTVQLLRVADGAEDAVESPLRFLLSARSAYMSGQVIEVDPAVGSPGPVDWAAPCRGKTAAVTGAARGIGAAIADVLERDGARVLRIDLSARPGDWMGVDITRPEAPERIVSRLRADFGGVDIFVHNAGITRDAAIAGMSRADWDAVLDVNLGAVERVTDALLAPESVLNDGGAIVCLSSIGGIAGNRGQTNYGASKAGIIGLVRALAPRLADRAVRVNAVAPGFIETDMTARMPFLVREAGRRMNSLAQAGLPVDVAETVAWLAAPATAGVTGQVVRVCGQSLLGA